MLQKKKKSMRMTMAKAAIHLTIAGILLGIRPGESFPVQPHYSGLARSSSTTLLQATVYHADGFTSSWEQDDQPPLPDRFTHLADFLHREAMDRLARLAVVFSPRDRSFQLEDVESVEVIAIDEKHIDIEAMLCEDDGCVTLSVPIEFPHECDLADEECIVENIGTLDVQATECLLQAQASQKSAYHDDPWQGVRSVLTDASDVVFPDWWLTPYTSDLVDECASIVKLLNEDEFESELKMIATISLEQSSPIMVVEQAAAAVVGASGLVVKAIVRDQNTEQTSVFQLPVKFSQPVGNVSGLRAAVLGLMALAEEA